MGTILPHEGQFCRLRRAIHVKAKIKFLQKPACTTCRKAKALLERCKVELESRDLGKDRLMVEELDALIGDRDYRKFLNTRNELYRSRKMGQNPPSREAALQLMASEPNLIRRPVVVRGSDIVLGYDEEGLKRIAK
jgi:Spx/MgsR family transcriptional regulator